MEESEAPPYLPPSMLAKRLSWDVFLSFRGEDTRPTITTALYRALQSNGVRAFMDDEGMERGDVIQPSLEEAIVDSALAVAIISPRYADSRWCLHELSRIFEYRKRVLPVFYGVDPSDVRRQKGVFGDGFRALGDPSRFSPSEVKRWRDALNKAGNISGYPCHKKSDEPELISRVVKQVLGELNNTPEYVVKLAVGLDSRVDKVLERLDIHSNGVRFLGIHGTPGIGKTTLAKALFNKLAVSFKNRCFVSNVRESLASEDGLLKILNKLITDLSLENVHPVKEEDAGKRAIKEIISEKRVLIMLDDVSEADQLKSLGVDERGQFEEGSRIVVTSRNIGALIHFAHEDELYEAEKLDDSESLELFSIHALGRKEPVKEYRNISEQIVSLTDGLPLALEVFGSYLVKKTKREWEDSLEKLRHIRPNNLQDVLKLSYDGLDEQEKIIFLDISCLLLQASMTREELVNVIEACGLNAEIAIGNLVTKSLLKIREDNSLWMHDQIRDMGRQIVMEKSLDDQGKRSRLWDFCDILSVLRQAKVADAIRGITVDAKETSDYTNSMRSGINISEHPKISFSLRYLYEKFKQLVLCGPDEDDRTILSTRSFEKMVNIKLLLINYVNLLGDSKHMPAGLRWLGWRGCPRETFPANLPAEIRGLDFSGSKMEDFGCLGRSCGFHKVATNLVVINLSRCARLTALPDMSGYRHLKKLILELCVGLTKIHDSIGNMSSLVLLNLERCHNLVVFPSDVTGMKGLRELILSGCSKFDGLPHDVRSMKSLVKLLADNTAIPELPKYLFHLTQLEVLSLNGCQKLRELPDWFGSLSSLKELNLNSTGLGKLPNSVGELVGLEKLSLMHCTSLTALPDSVGNLKSLVSLHLNSSSIEQLPTSIGLLSYLKILSLGGCRRLTVLPVSIMGLDSIVELELDKISIAELPNHICSLKFVRKLSMIDCTYLERLPESMGKMSSLSVLYIVGAALTMLPESIGELENLVFLRLSRCKKLCKVPDSIGNLRSLKRFIMEESVVTSLPESFGLLQDLVTLKMNKPLPSRRRTLADITTNFNHDLPRHKELPASFCNLSSLEEFDARACGISGQIQDDFTKLSKLETLNFSYNDFHSIPGSMERLCVLKKLLLSHCERLRSLPRLPSTLVELNAADCYALESIDDLSNLEKLQELQLTNCNKIEDVPGLECLRSLRRLFVGGCHSSASSVRRRLSKAALRNLTNLGIPGTEIPDWFSREVVNFATHPNLTIKSVLVGVVVSVDVEALDDVQAELPSIVDIQARVIREDKPIFNTVLNLMGVPITPEDHLYLCRFKHYHPLVLLLREGHKIEVGRRSESASGIELKMWGIHLVFENDDDYDGDEDLLHLSESQQSASQRLLCFFRRTDQSIQQ